jgi:hypothetical protein
MSVALKHTELWKKIDPMDPEAVELVEALNLFSGVRTISSCCGHGRDTFSIWFVVEDLESLPPILYHIDGCHSGVYGWAVEVTTDCAMSPVKFRLDSTSRGEQAYSEAQQIAKFIEDKLCL